MAELNGNPACAMISDEIRMNYTQLAQELYLGGSVNKSEKAYPVAPRGGGMPMRHFPPDGYICRKCNTAGHWFVHVGLMMMVGFSSVLCREWRLLPSVMCVGFAILVAIGIFVYF
jgi:hypothetical protein